VEVLTITKSKKASSWQGQSSPTSLLIVLFGVTGIVHSEFSPPNPTVNCDIYCDVLRRLRENLRRKRPEFWCNQNWLLHDDNAHTSLKTTEFVTNSNMFIVPHPPYSPDLAPCDFVVSQIENETEGTTF
jgi:histone-lysine N-methyltransferase SETMAR